jgi:hypothetical protein
MLRSAPDGARRIEYEYVKDSRGCRDLLAVACHDWGDQDCPVWVYVEHGWSLLASLAARDAEDDAANAEGWAAAAEAAYQAALASGADDDAVEPAAAAAWEAEDASAEARRAAEDAHQAACESAAHAADVDRAADAARSASHAASLALRAKWKAYRASDKAAAAARDAGVDPDALAAACDQAANTAYDRARRARRDAKRNRKHLAPRWRTTGYAAGRFHGDPRRALEALAAEYLGVRT